MAVAERVALWRSGRVVLVSILRRMFRRGPDRKLSEDMIEILAQRSVDARIALEHEVIVGSIQLPAGSRARVVLELRAAPLTHMLVTRIQGDTAGHGGRMTVIGTHLLMDRAALSERWPQGWTGPVRAHPVEPPGGLGAPREFEWQPDDFTNRSATAAAEMLKENDRVQRRMIGVLREPSTMQFELAPSGDYLRISVHQSGRELPDPTAVEALITVGRALAE